MRLPAFIFLLLFNLPHVANSWTIRQPLKDTSYSSSSSFLPCAIPSSAPHLKSEYNSSSNDTDRRRSFLRVLLSVPAVVAASSVGVLTEPAEALVRGSAPPPPRKIGSTSERKCVNLEECQELADRAAQEIVNAERALPPPSVTSRGTRYRELKSSESDVIAKTGDTVSIRYKILKSGKRSYDGISGEATVVFSLGYGLDDRENGKVGDMSFRTTIGDASLIEALSDGVSGMAVGSVRRIAILPEMGWRKTGQACDGGPGGRGTGGELKTDYVIVPTATMVAEEACFDKGRMPFPVDYAQQRRMAQRFDQSLIAEVELVSIDAKN
eukprot:CAMPEP_0194267476 /NCGR_PEP_ID=MMETSP0169-20130528/1956_1 /TAXON_ID=218684 /ORGANISM="Corethron pennatum, Strain L29A3" /LENGTH=324 /DNA_ID=CAMNT_0039008309 /DNA_START=40 /DNA_END=1014 /DNA_ORIENTATION=+